MKRWLLFPLLLSLAGCSQFEVVRDTFGSLQEYITGKDNAEPPTPLQEFKASLKVEKVWEESVGDGYDGHALNLIPVVEGEKLFVANHEGRVESRAKSTGKLLWGVDTKFPFSGGIGLGSGQILIGTDNGEVVALNSANGSVQWHSTVSSEVLSIPKVSDGILVVRCTDGRLYGLDAKTGARKWLFERSVGTLSVRVLGSPAIEDGVVVDGYASGKLTALKLEDGQVLWETMVAFPKGRSEIERLVDLGGEAAIVNGVVYVVGFQGGLAAVELKTGEMHWHIDNVSGDSGLVATRRSLFLTDDDGDVWRFENNVGGDMWRQGDLHQRRLSAPVLIGDYLAVGDFEGYVHFLSQDDGHLVGRIQVGTDPIAPRLVADDSYVYVYGKDGTLAALKVR